MLYKTHPRKRNAPPVSLSLADFSEFCGFLRGLDPGIAGYTIQFQGADNADVSANDVSLIKAADSSMPSKIVMPTITVSAPAGEAIVLRPETSPVTTGQAPLTKYVLVSTSANQVWAAGAIDTTYQWLLRKQSPLYKYRGFLYFLTFIFAILGALIAIIPEIVESPFHRNLLVQIPALIGAVAFTVVAANFHRIVPLFSVNVRNSQSQITVSSTALVLGLLASATIILQAVIDLFHWTTEHK
jgi:hypothetical protein